MKSLHGGDPSAKQPQFFEKIRIVFFLREEKAFGQH